MAAVLITGGAGYIGSHVAVALYRSERKVVILDDFSNASPSAVDAIRSITTPELPVIEGDAADSALLEKVVSRHHISSIVHLAAFKDVSESSARPHRYYRNNLNCTINVAEVSVEHGLKRIVFSSSAAVYGTPQTVPVCEETSLRPISPYGRSKLMCEQILIDSTSAATRLEVVLLRYFNPVGAHPSGVIGEDPTHSTTSLVSRIMQTASGKAGPVPIFGNDYDTLDGTAIRDFVHVMDLAAGHVAALENDQIFGAGSRSAAFNLGTGVGSSVLDMLNAAGVALGRGIPYRISRRRPGDIASIWADCEKARKQLGWTAQHNPVSMIRDHWNWQQRNSDGYR